ncbi:uncharacterized protein LOC141805586 [Halichoeres trimaculatus]|uniref:uncharacterized protein LOC141805586 n=1 Tax=Halichoeres trimaculatus TaxID=147232 RepID=UPI003D9EA35A
MTCKRTKVSFQRRDDGSSHHCCVPHCSVSARFNSSVSFFSFPKDDELHKQWMINIRRDNFVTTNPRVCGLHFQSEDVIEPPTPAGRRRLKKGAVPVLFPWNNFTFLDPRPEVWERTECPDTECINEPFVGLRYPPDHDYCSITEPAGLDMVMSLDHNQELHAEIAKLRNQIEEITINSKFCLERFAGSDDDIRFFTGFASHAHLMAFWKQIEPATCRIIQVLQPIDEFFLFMNYLSLGLMQRDLAHRFKIHHSAVSRIINTWANFLYTVLGAVGIWLDKETIKSHMPEVFQGYSDTQIILDCTEIRCQTPSSLLLKSEVLSNYKPHCTFKGLIGMAPHGAVTFVSSLFEGAISDKDILKQSGIVSLLNPSMAIMVDKSFSVEDCVPCKVYKPTCLRQKAQLSEPEVRKTQSIAKLRVHVEGLIRRVKERKLFSTVVPVSLTGSINQLYAVACLLVNYENRPLVNDWATNG